MQEAALDTMKTPVALFRTVLNQSFVDLRSSMQDVSSYALSFLIPMTFQGRGGSQFLMLATEVEQRGSNSVTWLMARVRTFVMISIIGFPWYRLDYLQAVVSNFMEK